MTANILVTSPYQPFALPDKLGVVFNGNVYCGTVGAVDPSLSQVQVYFVNESGTKVPVSQPLKTNSGGFLVYDGKPAKFVTDSSYSILVRNSVGAQVWYHPDLSAVDPESIIGILASTSGAGLIGTSSGDTVQQEIDGIKSFVADDVVVYRPVAGRVDDTPFVNDILANHAGIYFESGVYTCDPDVGFKLKNGSIIDGAGKLNVVILAMKKGATVTDLASYAKGSMVKRVFTPGVSNQYVSGVRIDNISLIMRHPTTTDAGNYRQIALDLRNIDRPYVGPGFYCGNTTLPGMPATWEPPRATQAQGYGIVIGTRNSNSVDYCGGVGAILDNVSVYGARKNIVVDETQLSPESAAHATIVRSPDVQIGVELISQASQYNAGTVFEDCLIQSMQRFFSSDKTIGMLIAGYNCSGSIRYLEGGPDCDVISALTSSSSDCDVSILYASVTGSSAAEILDSGVNNNVSYRMVTPVSGGKTTKGRLIETFNRGYKSRRVTSTFVNNVGPQVVTGDSGVSVSRTGAGAYTITLDKPFYVGFGVNVSAKTNPSRQGFSLAYSSVTSNSIKIDTYVNGALLDPEQMTIEIFQV